MPSTKAPTKQSSPTKKAAAKKAATKRAPVIPKAFLEAAAPKPAAKAVKKTAAPRKTAKTAPSSAPAETAGTWLVAARAADSKKASNIRVIDLREITTFADFFVICSGGNTRQTQAIANEVETELKKSGERPNSVEGYGNGEWVLLDYGDLVVHIFTEQARTYYDLDRLWRDGKDVPVTV